MNQLESVVLFALALAGAWQIAKWLGKLIRWGLVSLADKIRRW